MRALFALALALRIATSTAQARIGLPRALVQRQGSIQKPQGFVVAAELEAHERSVQVQAGGQQPFGVADEDRVRSARRLERRGALAQLMDGPDPAEARARPADFVAQGQKLFTRRLEELERLAVAPEIAQCVALGHQAQGPIVRSLGDRCLVDQRLGQSQRLARVMGELAFRTRS